jgi:hypothetical protein
METKSYRTKPIFCERWQILPFRHTPSAAEKGKTINIRSSIRVYDHSRDEPLSEPGVRQLKSLPPLVHRPPRKEVQSHPKHREIQQIVVHRENRRETQVLAPDKNERNYFPHPLVQDAQNPFYL